MMAAGFFVNGPYALITTAVSADLGTHQSLAGNEKALATVTAIIDGMGSIGAAIGPLMTGYISELPGGFDNVFLMLYGAAASAGLLLTGLVFKEVRDMLRRRRKQREQAAAVRDPSAANGEGRLTMGDTHAPDAFSFLPPGQPADGAVRTIDNETGGLV
jgi:MFS family permease